MNTRQVTEKLQDYQKLATDRAREVGEKTDEYVREHTWPAIAIAVGVGLVLGLILAGGRHSDED